MSSKIILLAQAVPEGRVFGLDSQTLISIGIQLFNGSILAVALAFILYNPVKDFMEKRREKIQKKIDDSDATMFKANELIDEYEAKLKNIDKEGMDILESARLKANDERKIILEDAKKEADEIKKKSLDSIAADKKRFEQESRLYIIELASLMAQRHISQNIKDEDQDRIFEETLAEMEDARWQN